MQIDIALFGSSDLTIARRESIFRIAVFWTGSKELSNSPSFFPKGRIGIRTLRLATGMLPISQYSSTFYAFDKVPRNYRSAAGR